MMHVSRSGPAPVRTLLSRFRRNRDGVAAIEFALVLPVMIAAYFGSLEVSQGFAASRKVAILSRTLADLAAQTSNTLSQADINNIFDASTSILSPFGTTNLKMTLSSVAFTTVSGAVVANTDWSVTRNGPLRACGTQTIAANGSAPTLTSVPTGLAAAGATLIVADVTFPYEPLIGGAFKEIGTGSTTSIDIKQTTYMRPRTQVRVQTANGVVGNKCSIVFP